MTTPPMFTPYAMRGVTVPNRLAVSPMCMYSADDGTPTDFHLVHLGGFAMGGIMGAGTKMMAAGLSMGQVQGVAREVLAYAREQAGEDAVGEVVGAIPGLSQFV